MELAAKKQPLYRDPSKAIAGGVCAGIAERLNIDVLLARTTAIVLSLLTVGIAVGLYLILWVVLPTKPYKGGVIDVRPYNAHSERYDKVIAAKAAARSASSASSTRSVRDKDKDTPLTQERIKQAAFTGGTDYRFSLILLALFCFLITLAIGALINANDAVAFTEFLPLYLVPIGTFFVASPVGARSFLARICMMILCFEACAVLLPFSVGICDITAISLLSSSSYLLWFIAAVFFIAGIALNNNVCFVLAITLVFFASGSSFFDLGFLDPQLFLTTVRGYPSLS